MRAKHPILAGLLAGALALPPAAFAQAAKPMTAQEALAAAAAQLCDPKSPDQARRDACRWVAGGGAAGGGAGGGRSGGGGGSAGGGAGGGGAAGGGASGGGRLPGPTAETSPRLPGEIVDYADQDPKRKCGVDALDLKLSAEYKTDMTKATDAAIAQLEAAGAAGTAAIVAEHAARIRAMQPDGGCR